MYAEEIQKKVAFELALQVPANRDRDGLGKTTDEILTDAKKIFAWFSDSKKS